MRSSRWVTFRQLVLISIHWGRFSGRVEGDRKTCNMSKNYSRVIFQRIKHILCYEISFRTGIKCCPEYTRKSVGIVEFSVKYISKLHLVLHLDLTTYIEGYKICSTLDQLCVVSGSCSGFLELFLSLLPAPRRVGWGWSGCRLVAVQTRQWMRDFQDGDTRKTTSSSTSWSDRR